MGLGGRGRGVKRQPTQLKFACIQKKPTIADANVKTSNMSCSNAPMPGGWSDTVRICLVHVSQKPTVRSGGAVIRHGIVWVNDTPVAWRNTPAGAR